MLSTNQKRSNSLLSARAGNVKKSLKLPLPPIDNKLSQTSRTSQEEFDLIDKTAPTGDMTLIIQIRNEMGKLLNESGRLIANSETTPDVQTTLEPIIKQLQKSFDVFYRSAMHYFRQQERMQQTAKVFLQPHWTRTLPY